MPDHDELCPQRHQYRGHKSRCVCALLAAARADEREQVGRVWAKREDLLLGDIEVARADERERIVAELEGPARESEAMYAHAEAVAAKLVEVVCEQDDLIQIVGVDATNHRAAAADMRRERDAARAEVAALRELVEVQGRNIRREVLADLRAKAEVLPERADAHTEECPGRPGYRGICTCEGDILISRAAVLTLFDEAAR